MKDAGYVGEDPAPIVEGHNGSLFMKVREMIFRHLESPFGFVSAVAVLGLSATPVKAGVDEVRAGVSLQSSGPVAPNVERGAAVAGEIVFDSPDFLDWGFVEGRPQIGGSVALDKDATSFGHAGLTWRLGSPVTRPFLDFGVGIAVHDGRTDFDPLVDDPRTANEAFLGCRALARMFVAPGVKVAPKVRMSLQWEHLSNANLCGENEGLDNFGFRLGVDF
ncbi:MAG: acyloxyacyl hydrolase [Pseudomonadota bacterium]